MLKIIAKGLAGRLLAYGVFGLGFWVLYRSLFQPTPWTGVPMGVTGGLLILAGMYLIVTVRRFGSPTPGPAPEEAADNQETPRRED